MTPLRKRMLEELQLRNLSQNTINQYLGTVKRYALHFGKSPQELGPGSRSAIPSSKEREKQGPSPVKQGLNRRSGAIIFDLYYTF